MSTSNMPVSSSIGKLTSMFGRPPLLPGEDAADFETLRADLIRCVQPRDTIEHWLLEECVADKWEIKRLQRFKLSLISLGYKKGFEKVLDLLMPETDTDQGQDRLQRNAVLAEQWFLNSESKPRIRAMLEKFPIEIGPAMRAEAMMARKDEVELIDHRIQIVEQRFIARLEQLYARRELLDRGRVQAQSALRTIEHQDACPQLEQPLTERNTHNGEPQ